MELISYTSLDLLLCFYYFFLFAFTGILASLYYNILYLRSFVILLVFALKKMFETCFDSHRIERIYLFPDACVSLMFLFQKVNNKQTKIYLYNDRNNRTRSFTQQ